MTPPIGSRVRVWPSPGLRVRSHGPEAPNRFIQPDGEELVWSRWLQERHDEGHVHLSDPRGNGKPRAAEPAPAPAAPAPAPTPPIATPPEV